MKRHKPTGSWVLSFGHLRCAVLAEWLGVIQHLAVLYAPTKAPWLLHLTGLADVFRHGGTVPLLMLSSFIHACCLTGLHTRILFGFYNTA
jgi:hypothetical protein